MKILYVVDNDFWTNSKGVDFRLLNLLDTFNDFQKYILYVGGRVSKKERKKIKEKFGNVFFVYPYKRRFIAVLRLFYKILKLPIPKHLLNPIKQSLLMKKKVNKIVRKNNIDVMWVFYIWNYDFANIKSKIYKILDTQDVASDFVKYKKENKVFFPSNLNLEDEIKIMNCFDLSIAVSARDYQIYKKYLNNKVYYLPFYFDCKNQSNNKSENNVIGFIGGSADFNVVSLKQLIDEIFPKVKSKCELRIFGSICEKVDQPSNPKIKFVGRVDKVEDMYNQIDLAVNPISFGSGLKTKCIEAMANSIPLITTNVGAQGIENGINNAFLVANSSDEFAKQIDKFFADKNLQESLKEKGVEFVKENFGIDKYEKLKLRIKKECEDAKN